MLRYTFRQLEYFVAVGQAGSIAEAAEKINVSSPSISAAIKQLEKELGLPLFVRQHAHGLALTSGGRRVMQQAQEILRQAEDLLSLAGDIAGNVSGPLSVGCLLTFAQVVLPSLRRSFEDAYPGVRVRQYEYNQTEIFSHLRRAELDLALTYDLDVPADLVFTPLRELPPYVIVADNHPLAHSESLSVEDLRGHPMVLLDLPLSSDYFLSFFSTQPVIAERTKDMAVMRSLVANGYGYSIVNIRLLNDRSPDGKPLRFIPLTGEVRPMKMGLLAAPRANSSSIVRAFHAHCETSIRQGNVPGLKSPVI